MTMTTEPSYKLEAYRQLVDEVSYIDEAAAEWMLGILENPKLQEEIEFTPCSTLASAFLWDCTQQGWNFWENIHDKLQYSRTYY